MPYRRLVARGLPSVATRPVSASRRPARSSHKIAGIREAIEARGAQISYLPPYRPDLNPIEQAFAKFKALLRKAAERRCEDLWQATGRIADLYPPAECRNFFKEAGYAT